MKIPMILIAVLVGLIVAYLGYNYLNQPQPMSDRIDNTLNELGNGNVGEAADEAGNSTIGEKINDDVKDATQPGAAQ